MTARVRPPPRHPRTWEAGGAVWRSPLAIGLVDSRLRLLRANPVLTGLLGRLDGIRHVPRPLPTRVEAELGKALRETFATGAAFPQLELALPDSDGEGAWCACIWPMRRRHGVVAAATVVLHDRTELRRRDEAALRAGRLLTTIVDGATSGLALVDRDLRFLWVNPALAAINGVPREAHLGRTLEEVLGNRPQATPLLRRVLERGEAVTDYELRLDPPRGQIENLVASYYPVHGPAGDVIAIGAVLTDVTPLRRAQAEQARLLAERDAALRAQAEVVAQLDALLDAAPVGIGFLDRELRVARANAALGRMTGIPIAEQIGRPLWEVVPGLVSGDVLAELRDVIASATTPPERIVTGRVAGVPGRTRTWVTSTYPVLTGGEVAGVGAVLRDVTSEREANAYRERVLGVVAHDLRNPLAALRGNLDAALRHPALEERPRAAILRARAITERMDRAVRDLLDFTLSHSEQGFPLALRPADVEALCTAIATELRVAHPARAIEVDCGVPWPALICDPDRLHQALENLLSNALKYGAPGAPVSLRWSADGDLLCFEIRNEGPPIAPDVLPLLFEPFERGARARTADGGLGLGLYIARAIARAHGGDVTVTSTTEATTFRLCVSTRLSAAELGAAG